MRVTAETVLPTYDPTRMCPKCRHDVVSTEFHENLHESGCAAECGFDRFSDDCRTFEHFDRWCRRCQYSWIELPLPERIGSRLATEETGYAEIHINRLRFVVAPGDYQGRDVRAFMHPPLTTEHDLYLKDANGDRLLSDDDMVTVVSGVEFYSAPRVINAGAPA